MDRPQTAGKAGRSRANAVRDERGRGAQRRREQALLAPSADRLLADARFLGFKGAVNRSLKTPSSVPVA
jgi:hypothetical protein